MSVAQAVQIVLKVAEVVIALLPDDDKGECRRALRDAFVADRLADLDAYARGRRRK